MYIFFLQGDYRATRPASHHLRGYVLEGPALSVHYLQGGSVKVVSSGMFQWKINVFD
jgi:hypothetical protein